MAQPLENDPRNPCIGCGPHNPLGLRLAFAREGDAVHGAFVPGEHHQGWPERVHSGVLYIALVETMNWAFWGLTGRTGVAKQTSALEVHGITRPGDAVRLRGRLLGPDEVEAVAEVRGKVVARMTRTYHRPDAEGARKLLGYERLPAVLEGAF